MRRNLPQILYEDEALLVCRKEAGVPVETARAGTADMVSILKNYRAGMNEEPYIGLVHRLDQPVEGVMVFARTRAAAAALSKQAQSRGMGKEYLAVTCGIPDPPEGDLEDTLLRDGRKNLSSVVPEGTPGGKRARLSYAVCERDEKRDLALVRIVLHTGRHHQIRVQFAHAGYPLYGDARYGRGMSDTPPVRNVSHSLYGDAGCGRGMSDMPPVKNDSCPLYGDSRVPLALCAVKLTFLHPLTGREMEFGTAPRGEGFQGFTLQVL